jgi:hypothetical protein
LALWLCFGQGKGEALADFGRRKGRKPPKWEGRSLRGKSGEGCQRKRGAAVGFFWRRRECVLWGSLLLQGRWRAKLFACYETRKLKAERGWGGGLSVYLWKMEMRAVC